MDASEVPIRSKIVKNSTPAEGIDLHIEKSKQFSINTNASRSVMARLGRDWEISNGRKDGQIIVSSREKRTKEDFFSLQKTP